jgi:hypothetical protein
MRLSEKELVGRGARISKLLRPISLRETGPAWSRLARGGTQIIIGTHDEARPSSDYRDWRFSINARGFVAMYFELWTLESRDRFILEKAYLNLYRWNGSSEKEIVCLHCDPSLSADADHAKYKRGPHLHMAVAGYPYDRAHIALQGPDLTPVLKSTETLHDALAWGIEMIRDEMIGLMQTMAPTEE